MSNEMKFADRIVMVSGAVSGIGKAAALVFARQGALVVGADLDEAGGRALVAQIEQDGGKAEFVRTDVSNEDDVAALIRGIGYRHGRLDVAFNNAGIVGEPMPLVKFTLQDSDRVVGINLTGVFLTLHYELMLPRGKGAIVNTTSIAGLTGPRSGRGLLRLQVGQHRAHPCGGERARSLRHPGQRGRARVYADRNGGPRRSHDARVEAGADRRDADASGRRSGRDRPCCRVAGVRRRFVRHRTDAGHRRLSHRRRVGSHGKPSELHYPRLIAARRHRPTPGRERSSSPIGCLHLDQGKVVFRNIRGRMIAKADDTELREGGCSCDSLST
jgi:hypothetical protein